ncbi:MAG: Wzz/FepE/Etk N-terminal domain-containing protein [Cyanobacteriota bacterium]
MENEFENGNVSINWNKISLILWHRKYWIIACYALIIALAVYFTISQPRVYVSNSQILINKSNSTNLADINPFVVSGASLEGGTIINLGNESLDSEIEILKSPVVLDAVIREMDLKYNSGNKKGQFISADHFPTSSLLIKNIPRTNIIDISYVSNSPETSYNMVNSIINNYQIAYEKINYHKATKDREFLEETYKKTKENIDKKITDLRSVKDSKGLNPLLGMERSDLNIELISRHDKRMQEILKNTPGFSLDSKQWRIDFEQELDKLKMLKEKYEWSRMVEKMSKNVSNVFVLKKPRKLEKHEYVPLKWLTNIVIALMLSFFLSCGVVYSIEKTSKVISYANLNNNYILMTPDNIDYSQLITHVNLQNITKLSIISLINTNLTEKFIKGIGQTEDLNILINSTTVNDSLNTHINNIKNSEYLIFLIEIGKTDKKLLNNLRNICSELNKTILLEYIFH